MDNFDVVLAYANGTQLSYDQNRVPTKYAYTRHTPPRAISQASANLFSVEFPLDLTTIVNTSLNNLFFVFATPVQTVPAGEHMAFCDLPAIKLLNRVEYYYNTPDKLIESYDSVSVLLSLIDTYVDKNRWTELTRNIGGAFNAAKTGTLESEYWVLPLPLSFLPLKISSLIAPEEMSAASSTIIVRLYLNSLASISITSIGFSPVDMIKPSGETAECYLIAQETTGVPAPRSADVSRREFYQANKYMFSKLYSKVPGFKSETFPASTGDYLNNLAVYLYNPLFQAANVFYAHYSFNAAVNFLNSFVNTQNATFPATHTTLNLRTGALTNPPTGVTVQLVTSNTLLITTPTIRTSLVCVGLDWSGLPEDVVFDLGSYLAYSAPVHIYKTLYFFVKYAALETVTPLPNLTVGANVGFAQGLFTSANGLWGIYGFQAYEFIDTATEPLLTELKMFLGRPVAPGSAHKIEVFAASKFVRISDPLYQFIDLDRTIKLGCSRVVTKHTDVSSYTRLDTPLDWYDRRIREFQGQTDTSANAESSLFTPVFSLKYAYGRNNYDYLDLFKNTLELEFSVGLFDSGTSQELTDPTVRQLFTTVYKTTTFPVNFVYTVVRLLVFAGTQIMSGHSNRDMLKEILHKFYENGVLPGTLSLTDIKLERRVNERKRAKPAALFLNNYN